MHRNQHRVSCNQSSLSADSVLQHADIIINYMNATMLRHWCSLFSRIAARTLVSSTPVDVVFPSNSCADTSVQRSTIVNPTASTSSNTAVSDQRHQRKTRRGKASRQHCQRIRNRLRRHRRPSRKSKLKKLAQPLRIPDIAPPPINVWTFRHTIQLVIFVYLFARYTCSRSSVSSAHGTLTVIIFTFLYPIRTNAVRTIVDIARSVSNISVYTAFELTFTERTFV